MQRANTTCFFAFGVAIAAALLTVPAAFADPSPIRLDVQCDKIYLQPGQIQFATITVHNDGATPAMVHLDAVLRWDLDKKQEIGQPTVSVPANGDASTQLAFPAGPDEFGYEIDVSAPDTTGVDEAAAYFAVHHNLWQVSNQGSGLSAHAPHNPLTTDDYRAQLVADVKNTYCDHLEFFAWAPDDFSTLDPTEEVWYAGQTSYPASKLAFHESIDALHSVGATVSAYAKGQMGGPAAFEFFRRHPEWTGAPYNSQWNLLDLKEFDGKSPFDQGEQHWPRGMCDFGAWPIADWHINQLRAASEEMRFDAVRYDDQLQIGWVNGGYNPMTERNMDQTIKQLRSALPYYGFGFNWITGSTKPTWDQHGGQPFPDWPYACAAGSQIMDEEIGQIFGNSRPAAGLPWDLYLKRLRYDRDLTEKYGGKVFIMQNQKLDPVDSAYRNALVFAMRLYHTNYDASAPCQFARFAMRYGCLLRSDNPIDIPSQYVAVSASRPVWGGDFAYRYRLSPQKGRIVIHLINTPNQANLGVNLRSDSADMSQGGFPAPALNARVQITLPDGWTALSATAIDAATMAKTNVPVSGATVDASLPPVSVWSVLVIDCAVKE